MKKFLLRIAVKKIVIFLIKYKRRLQLICTREYVALRYYFRDRNKQKGGNNEAVDKR